MTDFGDEADRQYTIVLPDRTPNMEGDTYHDNAHSVDEMRGMAVTTAHYSTATIHPLPLNADELVNGDLMSEFDVFYMEVITLTGEKHRLMFQHGGLEYMMQAIRNHALVLLENRIRRTGRPETIEVMEAIKNLMDKLERGGDSDL